MPRLLPFVISSALFLFLLTPSLSGQLVISAVFDGPLPGGQPKGIELYAFENIPDLSIFAVGGANNGDGTDGIEFEFPAVAVSAGTYLYLADEALGFTNFFGFAPDYEDNLAPFAMAINGNDAIELFRNGVLYDLFGELTYPVVACPIPWGYQDGWAARNMDVGPTTSFDPADWTYSGCDALDGESDNASAVTPVPLGEFTLPVSLTAFRAYSNSAGEVEVRWTTSEEIDNDYFAIERSGDGRLFYEIGRVSGIGQPDGGDYQFMDDQPLSGVSYYRLRQVDFDGATSYFGPRSVNMDKEDPSQIDVFPNPASEWLTISPLSDQIQSLRLVDQQGRTVKQWNLQEFLETNQFYVSDLSPGMYVLQAIGSRELSWYKTLVIN
ncbi:MAG: T9SS type A sorting domain-containing protein [Bacteroidota bacterium]